MNLLNVILHEHHKLNSLHLGLCLGSRYLYRQIKLKISDEVNCSFNLRVILFHIYALRTPYYCVEELLPDDIEYCWQDKFVVNSDGHVARLVERRRHRPHGVAQVHCPQQEEELSCEEMRKKWRTQWTSREIMCARCKKALQGNKREPATSHFSALMELLQTVV